MMKENKLLILLLAYMTCTTIIVCEFGIDEYMKITMLMFICVAMWVVIAGCYLIGVELLKEIRKPKSLDKKPVNYIKEQKPVIDQLNEYFGNKK